MSTMLQNPNDEAPAPGTELRPASGTSEPSGPARLTSFLSDVRQEMHKVVTPSREDVQQTTTVVIATVFLFAAYFWVVDVVFGRGVDKIFSWATRH